ncbi:MAG: integrase arm-type DNA-binding domain-containing protein [Desulfobulbaceae bacterium]|nr:integrase arm-type DNA-binding domain-containing protein [Desulfobulbaceae bacterium]
MPKQGISLLSDAAVRTAKPKDKTYMLRDGGGLWLVLEPSGRKWWKLRVVFAKKENSFSLGDYPAVSIADAREKRNDARKKLGAGIDPGNARKAEKAQNSGEGTFENVAREWQAKFSKVEWSESHSKNILSRLEKNIFPWLGARPVAEITAPEIISVFRKIEERGHLETLHRTLTNCGQVFRYAIATGRGTVDPTYKMGEAFPKAIKHHFSTITDPVGVGNLLRAIDAYHGTFVVKCALMLAPLVFLRPKELRLAEWSEFDFERAVWLIPINRMKRTRRDKEAKPKEVHIVPLSRQALGILKELYQLTGGGRLVFPGLRGKDRAISDATMTNALRRIGYDRDEMHVHGFRAMAKTMMKQNLKLDDDWIERQLSHAVKGPLGRAYDRTTFEPERWKMMQVWADYLDTLKAGAEINRLE